MGQRKDVFGRGIKFQRGEKKEDDEEEEEEEEGLDWIGGCHFAGKSHVYTHGNHLPHHAKIFSFVRIHSWSR